MHFAARQASNDRVSLREYPASMALPVPYRFSGPSRLGLRALAPVTLLAITLCGCSFDLGSLSSEPDKEAAPQAAPARARTLARSGKSDEALSEFDHALTLDPHNAEALYSRGLLYQGQKQYQLAIDDFTAANGLTPQRAEPLLGRAVSYLALDKVKEAATDLHQPRQAHPHTAHTWPTRAPPS